MPFGCFEHKKIKLMRAAVYRKYGGPEVFKIEEIDIPKINDDELLIKVHYTTVNRTDAGFRSAEYVISRLFSGLINPKINILGSEFSGEIIEIGRNVKQYKVGDLVFGYNDKQFGAYAEYLKLNKDDQFSLKPENLSLKESAAILEGSHYALCDIRAVNLVQNDEVLVYGATGAIGSAAVQILKAMNMRVTAICGPIHQDLLKSLGAEEVYDYTNFDIKQLKKKYKFFFDAVGKSSFKESKNVLLDKGIYISTELGKNAENIYLSILKIFMPNQKVLFPLPEINNEIVEYIKSLVVQNKFKPLIDREYKITEIVQAHKYVEQRQKIGNVIISML